MLNCMTGPQIATSIRTMLLKAESELAARRSELQEQEAMSVHLRAVLGFVENGALAADRHSSTRISIAGLFTRKELFAHCVKALQDNPPELSTRQLAEFCMRAKNLDPSLASLRISMMQRTIDVLTIYQEKGEIISLCKRGKVKIWSLPGG